MKFLAVLLFIASSMNDSIRIFEYQGQQVRTTFDVDEVFLGQYSGRKSGYLLLNNDGSGIYRYDIFGFAGTNCKSGEIKMEWGFLVNEEDQIVSFKREYGKSYPILMRATGINSFQGCREKIMLDFIMEYKDGQLGVSSSDDWIKD